MYFPAEEDPGIQIRVRPRARHPGVSLCDQEHAAPQAEPLGHHHGQVLHRRGGAQQESLP